MGRRAFKMFLKPGMQDEYKRRHDAIWPEMVKLLKEAGASDYRIYFDPATDSLFAIVEQEDDVRMSRTAGDPVLQRWWAHMADIMLVNEDNSPVTGELVPVFHLP